jgi:hypothetical protein
MIRCFNWAGSRARILESECPHSIVQDILRISRPKNRYCMIKRASLCYLRHQRIKFTSTTPPVLFRLALSHRCSRRPVPSLSSPQHLNIPTNRSVAQGAAACRCEECMTTGPTNTNTNTNTNTTVPNIFVQPLTTKHEDP